MMQKSSAVLAVGVASAAMLAGSVAAESSDQAAPMLSNAIELMARASATSEVLTLNLTNLLILLVLKEIKPLLVKNLRAI